MPNVDGGRARPYSEVHVKIRSKVILIVLPLIVTPLFVTAIASIFTARSGVTEVATQFLRFKAEELAKYAQAQWTILEENGLSGQAEYRELSRGAVVSVARSMVRNDAELLFAVDSTGSVAWETAAVSPSDEETRALASLAASGEGGWRQVHFGGIARVGQAMPVTSWGWTVLVTVSRDSFFAAPNQILQQSIVILVISAALSIALLLLFSGYLTRPLQVVVGAMRGIIGSGDLSQRVSLLYHDETGELGHTFNIMTGELQGAYEQIKGYALDTAIANKREHKIRTIFQKYVPEDVIESFFRNPEKMLVGKSGELAILFSDIRGFTTLAEGMRPEQVVASLNEYFKLMVDIITGASGIVDKYIGDAIMALFGAPVHHGDDAHRAVLAALAMIDALERFNRGRPEKGEPLLRAGIGINYGAVVIGNIGSEKKMDYTVIGDAVNLASRLEGLTKVYHENLIISDSVHEAVSSKLPCRHLDRVAVKGKTRGVDIYAVRRDLSEQEREAWRLHEQGFELYYARDFGKSAALFARVAKLLPGDRISRSLFQRSEVYRLTPPAASWRGVVSIREK